jgi:hypothetical protein
VFLVGAAVGVFAELKGILDEQSARNREQAGNLSAQTTVYVKGASLDQMKGSLAGIEAYQAKLTHDLTPEAIAYQLDIDGVRDAINNQAQTLRNAITTAEGRSAAMQVHAVDRAQAIASGKADQIKRAQVAAATAVRRVEQSENRAARLITAAQARTTQATRAATEAVKDKDLSVTIPITNRVSVTNGAISKTQTTYKKISGYVS